MPLRSLSAGQLPGYLMDDDETAIEDLVSTEELIEILDDCPTDQVPMLADRDV